MIKNKTMQKNSHFNRKALLGMVVLLILGSGGYFWLAKSNDHSQSSESTPEQTDQETINYTQTTDEEKQQTEDNKQRIVDEQQNQGSTNPGTSNLVTVIVTSADSGSVFARVSGVIEDGGTCTATFTKGSTTLSKSSDSVANVSDTQCGRIATPSLTSGNWQVVVSYKSNAAEGTSDPFAFTVP